jgi:hypothetical protein
VSMCPNLSQSRLKFGNFMCWRTKVWSKAEESISIFVWSCFRIQRNVLGLFIHLHGPRYLINQVWGRFIICEVSDTRKNAQLVKSLQTSCYKSVHKLSTSCLRTTCSQFVVTSLKQGVNNL